MWSLSTKAVFQSHLEKSIVSVSFPSELLYEKCCFVQQKLNQFSDLYFGAILWFIICSFSSCGLTVYTITLHTDVQN